MLIDAIPDGAYFIHPMPEMRADDGWYGNKFGIGKGKGGSVVISEWAPADQYFPSEADAVKSAISRGRAWVRAKG